VPAVKLQDLLNYCNVLKETFSSRAAAPGNFGNYSRHIAAMALQAGGGQLFF
jgi:hypothetical protein